MQWTNVYKVYKHVWHTKCDSGEVIGAHITWDMVNDLLPLVSSLLGASLSLPSERAEYT